MYRNYFSITISQIQDYLVSLSHTIGKITYLAKSNLLNCEKTCMESIKAMFYLLDDMTIQIEGQDNFYLMYNYIHIYN